MRSDKLSRVTVEAQAKNNARSCKTKPEKRPLPRPDPSACPLLTPPSRPRGAHRTFHLSTWTYAATRAMRSALSMSANFSATATTAACCDWVSQASAPSCLEDGVQEGAGDWRNSAPGAR